MWFWGSRPMASEYRATAVSKSPAWHAAVLWWTFSRKRAFELPEGPDALGPMLLLLLLMLLAVVLLLPETLLVLLAALWVLFELHTLLPKPLELPLVALDAAQFALSESASRSNWREKKKRSQHQLPTLSYIWCKTQLMEMYNWYRNYPCRYIILNGTVTYLLH